MVTGNAQGLYKELVQGGFGRLGRSSSLAPRNVQIFVVKRRAVGLVLLA